MTRDEAITLANTVLPNASRPFRTPFGSLYDDLSGQLSATGVTRFATTLAPIVATTLVVVVDSAPATAANINEDTGEFDVMPMPTETLLARYHWQWFTVTDLGRLVDEAVHRFQRYTTVEDVVSGHIPALLHYIRGVGYTAMAGKLATQVTTSLGARSEARSDASMRYLQLAEREFALGDKARDDFYKRAGQQFAPAQARATHPMPVYQPRR